MVGGGGIENLKILQANKNNNWVGFVTGTRRLVRIPSGASGTGIFAHTFSRVLERTKHTEIINLLGTELHTFLAW